MKRWLTCTLVALLLIGLTAGACLGGGLAVLNIATRPGRLPQLHLAGVRRLSPDVGAYHDPAWSPDGRHLAYSRANILGEREQESEIYVIDLETGEIRQLTYMGGKARRPSWSSDGTRIAFDLTESSFLEPTQIWLIDTDGSEARQISQCPWSCYDPVWHPDAQELLIQMSPAKGEPVELHVMNPSSGTPSQLTSIVLDALNAVWSPDGTLIAFTETDLSNPFAGWSRIAIVDTEAQEIRELPSIGVFDDDPSWSPDGHYLAFASKRQDQERALGNGEIYIMDLKTEELYPLLVGDFELGFAEPAWSPDGKYIAFVYGWPSPVTDLYIAEVPEAFR